MVKKKERKKMVVNDIVCLLLLTWICLVVGEVGDIFSKQLTRAIYNSKQGAVLS